MTASEQVFPPSLTEPLELTVSAQLVADRVILGEGKPLTAEDLLIASLRSRPGGGRLIVSGVSPVAHLAFLRRFLPLACGVGYTIVLELDGQWPEEALAPLRIWSTLIRQQG